jgi:hypothetical protein
VARLPRRRLSVLSRGCSSSSCTPPTGGKHSFTQRRPVLRRGGPKISAPAPAKSWRSTGSATPATVIRSFYIFLLRVVRIRMLSKDSLKHFGEHSTRMRKQNCLKVPVPVYEKNCVKFLSILFFCPLIRIQSGSGSTTLQIDRLHFFLFFCAGPHKCNLQ